MSQDTLIPLECTVCGNINYFSKKNKKTNTERIELNKFCKKDRKHTPHKETKLKK
jgi:large subunit ribosomal protein L33